MTNEPIIHIGLPKAASTYIKRAIFRRMTKNLVIPRGKLRKALSSETFSSDEFLDDIAIGLEDDEGLILSHESLSGRFWDTSDVDIVATNLASCFPAGRVIIVLREQLSYLRSVYAFCITRGRRMPEFGRFVEENLEGLTRRFAYDRLIELYHERFPKSNVLVIPYEKLSHDPSGFLNEIMTFCAMELIHETPRERKNASIREREVLETIRRINRVTHGLIYVENGVKALLGSGNRSLRRPWEHMTFQSVINRVAGYLPRPEMTDFAIPAAIEPALIRAIRESNGRAASLLEWAPADYGYLT